MTDLALRTSVDGLQGLSLLPAEQPKGRLILPFLFSNPMNTIYKAMRSLPSLKQSVFMRQFKKKQKNKCWLRDQ